ncbi:hypothetical protein CVV43_02860 [Candidatus Saccharibacteria bacterium HGW-Saccharibacteria-1]|nr:MAG: hypothetical protein CVV43_02860 [Candidatus Saccharibacteria bacterium HGW-Saccharibacteria-1]
MHNNFKNTMKHNKTTLLISIGSSVLTTLLISGVLIGLMANNLISFNAWQQSSSVSQVSVKTGTTVENSQVMNTVEKTNPAVVSIIISKQISTLENNNSLYNYLFNLNSNSNSSSNSTEKQEIGGGSGFFVSSDGYIVTNCHVVEDSAADYTVLTKDNKKYTAKIIAKDKILDVAVLKIEGKDFTYLTFADSDTLKLGQSAIAIGNALAEFQNSISLGIVSGLSRSITASDGNGSTEQLDGVIQTDAAINPGNSGGPLLDIKGNVIGVNVAIEDSANSIGFALPSNMVKSVVESVIKNGQIVKPYLGIRYTQINSNIKSKNNLSVDYGVLVAKGSKTGELAVIPGSPADKASIVENDIILEIDGVKIDETKSFASIIRQKKVDQTITLKVMHDGSTKEVKVKLEKAPNSL